MKKHTLTTPTRHFRRFGVSLIASLAVAIVISDFPASAEISPATRAGSNAEPPISNAAVRDLLSDAQKAQKSGNIRLAIILLKNAVTAAPTNGSIRAQLGLALLQSGDAVSAERELRQARANGALDQFVLPALFQAMLTRHEEQKLLDEFPEPATNDHGATAPDVLKARAVALQSLGRPADASTSMDRSLTLRRDVSGLLMRARFAEQQKDLVMARNLSEEALRLDPKNAEALMFKLGLLVLSNDTKAALAFSDQLVHQLPDNLGVRLARIELFLRLKQDANAKVEDEAILAKVPGAAIGIYYKALLLARANDVKGAWHIVQALPPEFVQSQPSIAVMVAQMAISSGNVETGTAILNAALAKFPNLVDVRLRLAALRISQNSPEGALGVLEPLKDSSDPRVLALFSQAYLKLKRYSDALAVLNKLNASGDAGTGAKRELALVEMQVGQSDQALKDLSDLAAKQPTDPTVIAPLIAALVQAKRFPEALAAADRLGSDPKQRVQSLFFRGQILVLQRDNDGALAAFGKALQLDPKNVASLYYRAGILEGLRRYPEATHDLQSILTIDPKNVTTILKLAEISARQSQDKTVRTLLAQATTLAPQDPAPRIALVRYLIVRHDGKGALAAANDMVAALPNNVDGIALLGELQLSLGQKPAAVATYRRLVVLLPQAANAQVMLANALFVTGDRAGAKTALDAAAGLAPTSVDVRSAQVNLLLAQNDTNGAILAAKSFQSANPGTPADLLFADTLVRAKQLDQAASVLTQSFASNPNSKTLLRLVQLQTLSGDYQKAKKLMADWLLTHQNDVEVRAQYATLLMQTGEAVNASAQYETVLKQDPNNVGALNNLGWLLQKADPKRALAMVTLAQKLAPASPDVMDTLGVIKLQFKDNKAALELLNRAHGLRPKDGEVTYHLVLALDANGNRGAAKGLLKALLDSGAKFDDLGKAKALMVAWH